MDRRNARETAFELLFEREFRVNEDSEQIIRTDEGIREYKCDRYTERVYFGVINNLEEIDKLISSRAIGWKTSRMTKVSLTILRISVFEMRFCDDIPFSVSINEAVELSKKYDDDKAPSFINGILNNISNDLGLRPKDD